MAVLQGVILFSHSFYRNIKNFFSRVVCFANCSVSMEALSKFVDTPDIVVSNSAHKNSPQALAAKKKPSSEASNVKKWLEQLASETPLVSKGLKELLFQQTALQNEVTYVMFKVLCNFYSLLMGFIH